MVGGKPHNDRNCDDNNAICMAINIKTKELLNGK
jgi:hypothetical protein